MFGVSGAALVARREALEDVTVAGECLDESFHMYKEDIDLCWRLRHAGWECWYVPSAVAYHGRTIHGTGRRSYLADVRLFRENERSKPVSVRMNSMKNQWVLLLKNDDLSNFVRDAPWVLGREALVVGYNVAFTPRETAEALSSFLRTVPGAVAKRRDIRMRRRVSSAQIRRWFATQSHPA